MPGPEVTGLGLDIRDALESLDLAEAVELASAKASPFNAGDDGRSRSDALVADPRVHERPARLELLGGAGVHAARCASPRRR